MANVRCGNSVFVDSTGAITGTDKNVKVSGITFTSKLASDSITIKDSSTSGALKLTFKSALADDTKYFDFSRKPLLFPNGLYISAISANCTAMIILTTSGGD